MIKQSKKISKRDCQEAFFDLLKYKTIKVLFNTVVKRGDIKCQ